MQQSASMLYGKLFVVATPIGNLQDISQRAIEVLSHVDLIVAEDTRHSYKLLQTLGLHKQLMALHAHNEQTQSKTVIEKLLAGKNIALISDAGTPLISDPGMPLIRLALEHNINVSPIPGACAAIAALSVAGLPCDKFFFRGFLPATSGARCKALNSFIQVEYTVIFYEAPHRILDLIQDMLHCYGDSRVVVVAKEITKIYENFFRGNLQQALTWLNEDPNHQRGEFVVMLAPQITDSEQELAPEVERILAILLQDLPLKQAVKMTAEITKEQKNKIYDLALRIKS